MNEALPEELGGFERSDTTAIEPFTQEGLASVQMLEATMGLGAALEDLEDEERSLDGA